ncbi:urinary protein rup /acrosomal protein sp-10 [Anaeramoeba flamelloides]|uniref:Urinary protein rup /acrosomal protein sp-10 n=1 Tax=Anaeramoeba flamelloides TaxID=1746091 RepID=A0AAV7Y5Z4_9EUKA|nr:urinary protein rup /acrosomal protein sp-10 [Anaeramoeba flamelloides]
MLGRNSLNKKIESLYKKGYKNKFYTIYLFWFIIFEVAPSILISLVFHLNLSKEKNNDNSNKKNKEKKKKKKKKKKNSKNKNNPPKLKYPLKYFSKSLQRSNQSDLEEITKENTQNIEQTNNEKTSNEQTDSEQIDNEQTGNEETNNEDDETKPLLEKN